SSANRFPTRRAAVGSLCSAGSDICASRPACSARMSSMAEGLVAPAMVRSALSFRFLRCALKDNSTLLPGKRAKPSAGTKKPTPDLHMANRASAEQLVFGLNLAVCALAVASLEASNASTGVENLLLARVEGMALRANLDVDASGLFGA